MGAGYLREWGVKVFVLWGGGSQGGVVPWVKNRPGMRNLSVSCRGLLLRASRAVLLLVLVLGRLFLFVWLLFRGLGTWCR